MIQLGGLHPWDPREIAVAARVGVGSDAEKAVERMLARAPRIGRELANAIEDARNSVRVAQQELESREDDDPLYRQVLETVADEFVELMPLLMLSPGGPYSQILRNEKSKLEREYDHRPQLEPEEEELLARINRQLAALESLADDDRNRLVHVAGVIDQYDERMGHAPAHAEEKRTLN